jgi:hypothetical protein
MLSKQHFQGQRKDQRDAMDAVPYIQSWWEWISRDSMRNALQWACEVADLDVFRKIKRMDVELVDLKAHKGFWMGACARGKMDLVKRLHEMGFRGCSAKAMDRAAGWGRLDIVKYLHENRTEGCTVKAMDEACKWGHLDVVEFLQLNRSEGCSDSAMTEAACRGHLEVVRLLHDHHKVSIAINVESLSRRVGLRCKIELLKFLYDQRPENSTYHNVVIESAVSKGWLEGVKYLHEVCGLDLSTDQTEHLYTSPEANYTDLLHYIAIEKGVSLSYTVFLNAIRHDLLSDVKHLHEFCKLPITKDAIVKAGRKAHLPILHYLLNKSDLTTTRSALSALPKSPMSYEILKLLLPQDAAKHPFKILSLVLPLTYGNDLEGIRYLLDRYLDGLQEDVSELRHAFEYAAVDNGNLDIVRALWEMEKLEIDDGWGYFLLHCVVSNWDVEILKYLDEVCGLVRLSLRMVHLEKAVKMGRLEMVRYISKRGNMEQPFRYSGLMEAMKRRFYGVVRFMLEEAEVRDGLKDVEQEVANGVQMAILDRNLKLLEILAPFHDVLKGLDLNSLDLFGQNDAGDVGDSGDEETRENSVSWAKLREMFAVEGQVAVSTSVTDIYSQIDIFERELDN